MSSVGRQLLSNRALRITLQPHSFASSSAKLYREWREGIDQRRKESIDKWNAEHPDQPKEFKPYLTWGEEQDLKLAEMKRLREQEQARLREQAASAS